MIDLPEAWGIVFMGDGILPVLKAFRYSIRYPDKICYVGVPSGPLRFLLAKTEYILLPKDCERHFACAMALSEISELHDQEIFLLRPLSEEYREFVKSNEESLKTRFLTDLGGRSRDAMEET